MIVIHVHCDGEGCEEGIVVSDPHVEVGGAGGVSVRGWAGPLPEDWVYQPSEFSGRGVDLFCGKCREKLYLRDEIANLKRALHLLDEEVVDALDAGDSCVDVEKARAHVERVLRSLSRRLSVPDE